MALIVLLYVASIACCNWFQHGEKEGNIFLMNINEQTVSRNLKHIKASSLIPRPPPVILLSYIILNAKDGGRPGNKAIKQVSTYGVGRSSIKLNPTNQLQTLPICAGVPGFLSPIMAPCGPCSPKVYLLLAMAGAHASVPGQATQDLGAHSRYDGPHTIPPPP